MPGMPIGANIQHILGTNGTRPFIQDIQRFMAKSNYIPAVPPGNVCPNLSITGKHGRIKTVPSQVSFTAKIMVEAYRLFSESKGMRVSSRKLRRFMVEEAGSHTAFPKFAEFFGRGLDAHVFQKQPLHMSMGDVSIDFSRDEITGLNPCNSITTICSSKPSNQRVAVHDIGEQLPIIVDISPRGNSNKHCLSKTVDKYEIGSRFRDDGALCEIFELLKHKLQTGDVLLSDIILFFYLYNPDADGVDILSMTCTTGLDGHATELDNKKKQQRKGVTKLANYRKYIIL